MNSLAILSIENIRKNIIIKRFTDLMARKKYTGRLFVHNIHILVEGLKTFITILKMGTEVQLANNNLASHGFNIVCSCMYEKCTKNYI